MAHKSPLDTQARGRRCLTECQRVGDVLSTLYPSSSSYSSHTFPLRPIPRVLPYSVPHGLTLPPILLLARAILLLAGDDVHAAGAPTLDADKSLTLTSMARHRRAPRRWD